MADPASPPRSIRFGVFEVDLRAGELRKHGLKIKLQEQPFQVLAILLERPGELVTREEIQEKIWGNETFVDFEHGLATAIKKLRQALGDSADNPRFVETLPRRGYRFIAPVEGVQQPSRARVEALYLWVAGAGLAATLAVLVGLNVGGLRDRIMGTTPAPKIESIAVLPLENLSGDPEQEYFADGMTDALITDLGRIRTLRVISRSSVMQYKGKPTPAPQVAQALNVDAVVEGTVQRSGERVRITAQLIDARNDRHLWARSYERELRDTLDLQSELSRAIADEIQVRLTPEEQARLTRSRPVNPEAHEAYLRGRYFLNRRTPEELRRGLESFLHAVGIDPNYAAAYAGIADSYALMAFYGVVPSREAFAEAKAAAIKAMNIDPSLAEPHAALAYVRWFDDWDWTGTDREFKQAIDLNPGYATAHHWYAAFLATMGKNDEAIAEIRRAHELDPVSLIINAEVGWVYYSAGRYDEAIEQFKKTLEMDPNFQHANNDVGKAYRQKGMYKEAAAAFEKAIALSGQDTVSLAHLGYVYALWGKRDDALKVLDQLMDLANRRQATPYSVALICVGLGRKDQAFTWLEKGFEERGHQMVLLKTEPSFDPLRSDPRFQDLLHRMDFPP
jgi:TolB-like protein/DNA-binding winged helix-turn-helix (wHTH) protein/Tfp pilus assembly protein PilF